MFEPESRPVPWYAEQVMHFKEFFAEQSDSGNMPPLCLVGRNDLPAYIIACTGGDGSRNAGLTAFMNLHLHVQYDSLIFATDSYVSEIEVSHDEETLTRHELERRVSEKYPEGSLQEAFQANHERSGIKEMCFVLKAEKSLITEAVWLPYFHAQGNPQVLWFKSQFHHQTRPQVDQLTGAVPGMIRKVLAQPTVPVDSLLEYAKRRWKKTRRRHRPGNAKRFPGGGLSPARAQEIREHAVLGSAQSQGHTVMTAFVAQPFAPPGPFPPR